MQPCDQHVTSSQLLYSQVLKPMAKVAREVVRQNGCGDVITVVPKRSTEMRVGPGMCTHWQCAP